MGRDFAAYDSSSMLATIPAPVNRLGTSRVNPCVYGGWGVTPNRHSMPIDQPTSSRPATTSKVLKNRQKGLVTMVTSPVRRLLRRYVSLEARAATGTDRR